MTSTARRNLIKAATGIATAAAFPSLTTAAESAARAEPTLRGPFLDLTTPQGNVEAYARIAGTLNPKETSYSWYSGRVTGIRPGEAATDLMNIIGMGAVRMLPLIDEPGYQMLRKELGFFTDASTNEVIDNWRNPYLGETVEVVHLANPNINAKIQPYKREQGLYKEVDDVEKTRPFLLPWKQVGDRALVEQHVHLYAENPLDPEIWKRESSGHHIAISDSNTFNVALADLQNPDLKKVPSFGNWTHQRPWQPWMLMGSAPGFIQYTCFTGSAASLDDLPPQIVALARERFPEFMTAPTEAAPPESSLVRYMRTRSPQPMPGEKQ